MKKSESPASASGKKPYSTPVLQVYGDLRVITKNLGTMTTPGDGGSNDMHQQTTL